jgi:DNA-binding HxlR family transcriptional regulator
MEKNMGEEILKVLLKPSTVTEIKTKIPKIKSFGTIAYHLKRFEEEGIVIKKKEANKQGKPTTYQIKENSLIKSYKKEIEEEEKKLNDLLLIIKNNPEITRKELISKLEEADREDLIHSDVFADKLHNQNYCSYILKITKKGLKHLKENKK